MPMIVIEVKIKLPNLNQRIALKNESRLLNCRHFNLIRLYNRQNTDFGLDNQSKFFSYRLVLFKIHVFLSNVYCKVPLLHEAEENRESRVIRERLRRCNGIQLFQYQATTYQSGKARKTRTTPEVRRPACNTHRYFIIKFIRANECDEELPI